MNIEKIRHLCHAEPFHPFIVHLPEDRAVPMEHPDLVAFAPSGRLISVYHPDDSDVMLVSDITLRSKGRRASGKN